MTLVSRISPNQREEMRQLRATGMSYKDIGERYDISEAHAYNLIQKDKRPKTEPAHEICGVINCKNCGMPMSADKWRIEQQGGLCFMCWWNA